MRNKKHFTKKNEYEKFYLDNIEKIKIEFELKEIDNSTVTLIYYFQMKKCFDLKIT